jgi:hypothetical protein
MYLSAQSRDFFALALLRSVPRLRRGFPEALTLQKNVSFLIWKLEVPIYSFPDGHEMTLSSFGSGETFLQIPYEI